MNLSPQEIETLNTAFETETPEAMLRWALDTFGRRLTLGTSLGPQGIIMMHLLSQLDPGANIFFLDTGLHFPETYDLLARLETHLGMHVTALRPALTVAGQAAAAGPALWSRDPDTCCAQRKVEPMVRHLQNYDIWLTGVRRTHSATRAATPILSYASRYNILKLNPLAAWDDARIWAYIAQHDLPTNALHAQNYPSIGCQPCTRAVAPGEDPRAGRWSGFAKTECGLHLPNPNRRVAAD
jgi:phosphoadenosine phosphosulfate reductase